MAATHSATKKKPVTKTIVFGAVTAALYAAAFWNSDYILQLFTRAAIMRPCHCNVFIVSFGTEHLQAISGRCWASKPSQNSLQNARSQTVRRPAKGRGRVYAECVVSI